VSSVADGTDYSFFTVNYGRKINDIDDAVTQPTKVRMDLSRSWSFEHEWNVKGCVKFDDD
jgi:hypothetical protein